MKDQTAATIATLLVEQIISRHGVPAEVLSDRGKAFLSELFKEVEKILGFCKVNTTAYHPQTDGLVECFNRTLIAMLAKTSKKRGRDWDRRLPYLTELQSNSQHWNHHSFCYMGETQDYLQKQHCVLRKLS